MKIKMPKIEELFEAGVHIGHQVRKWHPKMEKYLYTSENKVHVFDLEQTLDLLQKAAEFLYEAAKSGGQVIFVGTKRQASTVIKEMAKKSGALYVSERWIGGTLTNYRMIKRNMDKLVNMMKQREAGEYAKFTKKERLLIDREIEKLEKNVGGIVSLKGTPTGIFVIDPKKEKTVVREASRSGIKIAALIDSNSDPSLLAYPIPGNDDAVKSITLIVSVLADAVEEGYKDFEKDAAKQLKAQEKAVEDAAKAKEAQLEAEKPAILVKTDVKDEIEHQKGTKKEKSVKIETEI